MLQKYYCTYSKSKKVTEEMTFKFFNIFENYIESKGDNLRISSFDFLKFVLKKEHNFDFDDYERFLETYDDSDADEEAEEYNKKQTKKGGFS